MTLSERIYLLGIVPVIKLDSAEDAVPLAKALLRGGLSCAEITFRTDAAEESIRRIHKEVPEVLVGAGTVLTIDQAERAIKAGAAFIVSPGFNPKTSQYCIDRDVPVYPGCNNPSVIEAALEIGLTDLKFFPAEQSGGLAMIKSLAAPYTSVRFMPTGGVNEENLNDYLAYPKVMACGGTWMVKDSLIKEGRFDEIERLTAKAVETMLSFKMLHVGLNCSDAKEAAELSARVSELFSFPVKDGNSSIMAGSGIEFRKTPYLGAKGHIAIGVNSVDRAYYHLSQRGVKFRDDTLNRGKDGRLKSVYLQEEFSGFAVHLCENQ